MVEQQKRFSFAPKPRDAKKNFLVVGVRIHRRIYIA
jgi:hypothetical protein